MGGPAHHVDQRAPGHPAAVVVAIVTYVVTLMTAPKGTPVDRRAVGYPLAAGVIALIAVYVVVNLVEFAANTKRAGPRLRVEVEQRRQDALVEGSRDTIMKDWLRMHLAQLSFDLQFAAAFGSVTEDVRGPRCRRGGATQARAGP